MNKTIKLGVTTLFVLLLVCVLVSLCPCVLVSAEEVVSKPSSGELITKAWGAHGKRDIETTFKVTRQLIDLYKDKADEQQRSLKALPKGKEEIEAVQILNDVATAYFIEGEAYLRQENVEHGNLPYSEFIYFMSVSWR